MNYSRCEYEMLLGRQCRLDFGHTGGHKPEACPSCESESVQMFNELHSFTYGVGDTAVKLSATFPGFVCKDCDFGWSDHRGEEARDAAVRKYRAEMETPV